MAFTATSTARGPGPPEGSEGVSGAAAKRLGRAPMIGRFVESRIGRWARNTVLSKSPPPTAEELSRAHAYAAGRTAAMTPGICLIAIGLLGLWALVDLGTELAPVVQQAYYRLRGGVCIAAAAGLLLAGVPALRNHGRLYLTFVLTAGVAVVGWSMSVFPPSQPYIHTTSWLAFASLLVVVPFGSRVLVALAVSSGMWLGYVVPQWHIVGSVDHAILLSNLVGLTVVAVIFGQLLYLLLLDLFVARERLDRLRQGLESRVEAATAEMRALNARIDTVREDERRWMAHAVHDELGQELTAMRYTLALGQDQVRAASSAAPATLDDLEMLLDRTNATMRRIIRRLRPVALDELGFVGALRWLGRDLGKRVGCRVVVTVGPEQLQPPHAVAEMLFRAAQEALNNVAKHANASNVLIVVEMVTDPKSGVAPEAERWVEMTIEDDGQGLPEGFDSRGGCGLGMVGIRERAKSAGGRVAWYEADLGGVGLRVQVPAASGDETDAEQTRGSQ